MEKTPYLQLEYVVTLSLNKKHSCEIITDCLAIDSKSYPKLLETEWRENPCNIVLCLRRAADEWYDEADSVGIINYWFKDSVTGSLDARGAVMFD